MMDDQPEPPTEPYAKDVSEIMEEINKLFESVRKLPPARSESEEKQMLLHHLEGAQIELGYAKDAAKGEYP